MNYMKQLFGKVQWWKLQPASDLIKNQSPEPLNKMVFSKNNFGDFGIAYLPDNDSIQLDLSAFSANLVPQWFNPINNTYLPVSNKILNKRTITFTRPATYGDWVLLIRSY